MESSRMIPRGLWGFKPRLERWLLPLLAVAWNLVKEATRHRASALFVLFLAATALLLPFLASSGRALMPRLQVAVAYGMGFPIFLLAMATVVLAASSLSREVGTRRIQPLATKPLARWQIALGKMAGIAFIDAVLVLTVLAIFALNLAFLRWQGGFGVEEWEAMRQRFFTARSGVHPVPRSVDPLALSDLVKSLSSDPRTARGKTPEEIEAQARRALEVLRVEPTKSVELVFEGPGLLRSRDGEGLIVRYQLAVSPPQGSPQLESLWEAPAAPAVRERTSPGTPHEFLLPASSLSEGAKLRLFVRNPEPSGSKLTLLLDPAKVELLYASGRFWPNVLRSLLLVLAQFLLLASVGLVGSAVFTFPTANLLGFFLYFTSLASSFLRDAFAEALVRSRPESLADRLSQWIASAGRVLIQALPDLTSLDPLTRLAEARAVTFSELASGCSMILVEAMAAFLAASWLFSRRELAAADAG